MQQAGYHHANSLAQQIQEHLQESDSQMMALLQNIPSLTTSSTSSFEEEYQEQQTPVTHAANSLTDSAQLEILKLLRQIQLDMKAQQQSNTYRPNPPPQPACRPRVLRATKTPDDARPIRKYKGKYCWTHGACGHSSVNCKDTAPGHKDEATKENKLDGSKVWCN